jgi:glycosyltransferase involved in cell wall biosynthesis
MKILIATITHSRPKGLAVLLDNLQAQVVPDVEIIDICVVDNDCTGENDSIVNERNDKPYTIALIKEQKKGIVYARNAAVEYFLKSDFDALAFIDDDEWTSDIYWLENLVIAMQASGADIVTSDVLTIPENESISWTTEALGRSKNSRNLTKTDKFYTGNVLIKRHVLETIRPAFDKRFALTGSSDFHFSLKCKNAGFQCVYTNQAPVYEIFPESRAKLKWFFLRGYRNGSGASRAEFFEGTNKLKTILMLLLMSLIRQGRGVLTMLKGFMTLDKGSLALGIMRFASGLGTIAGMFNLTYEEYKTIHGR